MQSIPIDSSMIRAASYDEASQELHITFKNGARYVYSSVPQEEADALASAESAGSYFISAIRDAYVARRV